MNLNKNLQIMRKEKNYSQEMLSEMVGVSRQAVSKWEAGISYPEMDKLLLISKIFDCSIDDLVKKEHSKKDPIYLKKTTINLQNQ